MTTPRLTLERQVGLWSAVAIVIGTTIGSGIFRTPARIADRLPGPAPMFSIWVIAGILAMCGALTLAEVASANPRTGGIYAFLRGGWGRLPAFLFGWAQLTVIRAAALGAIATTFAEYLLRGLGYDTTAAPYSDWVHYVAAGAIILTATFNYVGLRSGSFVQNITTIGKYAGLLFVILLALSLGLPQQGTTNLVPLVPEGQGFPIAAFGLALVSVLWAYDGWADLTYISGEIKDPARNIPRALITGTAMVIGIYLLANFSYVMVLGIDEMRRSPLVAADVASRLVGAWGVTVVAITVMVSTFGTLNGSIMTSPRIFYAMAGDGMLFRRFASVHPRFGTPHLAIALSATLGVIFVLLRDFESLADAFVTAILPFYALGVASIFAFRRQAGYAPPFRTPLYPLTPILFVSAVVYLLVNAMMDAGSRTATLAVFGIILLGIPVYYAAGLHRGANAPPEEG
jgi:basic amino acid/polyamine antiporter, APA family